jgi:LysR family glycine cleavage system transcriptional activator
VHALIAIDAVATFGSLAKAAEYLGITRSAVSHRLALLETSVGFEVIKRCGKHGISLTPRGKRYAEIVHNALFTLSEAQTSTEDMSG